jgi:8-oxo-dGTP diphosphatase
VTARFCAMCGTALVSFEDHGVTRRRCPACATVAYENAKPCAGTLITRGRTVLLVRRAIEPFKDHWDLVGGYLEAWEHPEDGARREAREETGLEVALEHLLPMRLDRYGDEGWTLNMYYVARVVGGTEQPGDDAIEARWFDADDLPTNLAFPNHLPVVLDNWRAYVERQRMPEG